MKNDCGGLFKCVSEPIVYHVTLVVAYGQGIKEYKGGYAFKEIKIGRINWKFIVDKLLKLKRPLGSVSLIH